MNRLNNDAATGTVEDLDGSSGRSADPLGPNSEIGRKLRQYYEDLIQEDVPDRFTQLLSQLSNVEAVQDKD